MMICDDVRALLTARADGELSAADSLRTESHLATCAACAVARGLQNLLHVIGGDEGDDRRDADAD
ncbi:anti-sigma factor family protein, partial [Ralstonia pseudosolanacearum]|uniref:anti-sigma factor family protein n=1 Tax=Ralstonia pseudosolanacearum TaxID=1310165 RepID=UPI003CF171F2